METLNVPPAKRAVVLGEWLFLGLLVGALLALNIPAQWTGIATDPDFTAWVAPLSNRLAGGMRLYDFGGHMPLPPLAYVLLYWLSGGHATWLTESIWNHVAVMLSVLLLYGCMARHLPRKVALLGAIAALATLSGSNCVLFYCSLPNLFVTCLACIGVGYARRAAQGLNFLWLAAMGIFSMAVLLTKQNVGGLALFGVVALIVLVPNVSMGKKIRHLLLYGLFSVVFFGMLCLVLSPWVSIPGMIQDAFLTGSECKGGTKEIVAKLASYGFEVIGLLLLSGLVAILLAGTNFISWRKEQADLADISSSPLNMSLGWVAAFSLIGLIGGVLLARLQINIFPNLLATEQLGLIICLFTVVGLVGLVLRSRWILRFFDQDALLVVATLTLILLPAAAGYSVTTPIGERRFYWYMGIIPFIQVALTAVIWLFFVGAKKLPQPFGRWAAALFVFVFIAQNWQPWRVHWLEIKNCTQTWAGVPWFAGARVTTLADPLKGLVTQIHELTQPGDTVLLLPDDPNFEECFDRPRPALNCAIIFTDQYWLRYAEDDFARLQRDPPKMIILGPRDHWRDYSRLRNNTGAVEALIDPIEKDLLPAHYRHVAAREITYRGGVDYLDVWLRRD